MAYENYQTWKTTPISGKPYLSIVIPAYNESERIIPTIGAIASYVSDMGFEWELIVADDGSKDNTVKLLQDLGFVNLQVLIADKNGGKGSAVQRGMLAAKGDYVLFSDADNSTPIQEINKMLATIKNEGFDVVVGSRATDGASETNKSILRHILSNGLRMMVKYLLGINVRDTQCGFKLFTEKAAKHLFSTQTITGFSFDLEILYLASKFNYKVSEVPVTWMDAPGSKVDTRKEIQRFLKDIGRIRLNDLRRLYNKDDETTPVVEQTKTETPIKDMLSNVKSIAVVTAYPPSKSSLNEYAYHFIEALRRKPSIEEIFILTDELPDGEKYPSIKWKENSAKVTIIPCWKFDALGNTRRIQSVVNILKPDAVLFNIQFASFGGSRIPAALGLLAPTYIKRTLKIPTAVLLHNIMETVDLDQAGFSSNSLMTKITRFAGYLFTHAILQADLVAVTIPKYVEILRSKYQASNVFLAPHGAFYEVPKPTFETKSESKLQIMTFGKFGTYKRVEKLIEAFEILQKKYPDKLELIIAGTDNPNIEGYLQGIKESYAHVNNVCYTGYVAEDAVPSLFQNATVVVFPYTSTTGSSGVLHQAGSYGKAVVLPNLGDFAELIKEEGYSGEFFEPDNAVSLSQAIETLINDESKRIEQGKQNFMASNGISINDVVDWYILHYERLVA